MPHPYGKEIDWEATLHRGVKSGDPIPVGTGEPYQVVYFDGYGRDDCIRTAGGRPPSPARPLSRGWAPG